MHELVSLEQADAIIRGVAWGLPVAGILVGLIAGLVQGRVRRGLVVGVAFGLLGPIIWAMWLLYGSMVRYDPETGRAGLHSVATHALAALIFVGVGALLGAGYRRLLDGDAR